MRQLISTLLPNFLLLKLKSFFRYFHTSIQSFFAKPNTFNYQPYEFSALKGNVCHWGDGFVYGVRLSKKLPNNYQATI
jgi:hypothetical protein